MPAPLEVAQDLLARIYFRFKPDSAEWKTVEQVIRLVAPIAEAARTAPATGKKSPGVPR